MNCLHEYVILYRTAGMGYDEAPYGFLCEAQSELDASALLIERIAQAEIVGILQDGTYVQATVQAFGRDSIDDEEDVPC